MNNDKGFLSGSITILIGAVIAIMAGLATSGRFHSLGTVGSFDLASPLYAAG